MTLSRWELIDREEFAIITQLARAKTDEEIAAKLRLSLEEVKGCLVRIHKKTRTRNRVDLAVRYVRQYGGYVRKYAIVSHPYQTQQDHKNRKAKQGPPLLVTHRGGLP